MIIVFSLGVFGHFQEVQNQLIAVDIPSFLEDTDSMWEGISQPCEVRGRPFAFHTCVPCTFQAIKQQGWIRSQRSLTPECGWAQDLGHRSFPYRAVTLPKSSSWRQWRVGVVQSQGTCFFYFASQSPRCVKACTNKTHNHFKSIAALFIEASVSSP